MSGGGILYSFRRCPYAIRARLALAAAGITVEVREVALKAKPPELGEASPQGTVPALVRPTGEPLTESLDILLWAVGQLPDGTPQRRDADAGDVDAREDDARDAASRELEPRQAELAILRRWNRRLETLAQGQGHAFGQRPEPAWLEPLGWALWPFVRQFRLTDPEGFARASGLAELRTRLAAFEAGDAFARVMAPPWAFRQPWRSPRWLYHLALEEEWQVARRQGAYTRSTRGRSLEEEGFIHASWCHQLTPTWRRFYSDAPPLRLLVIDPERLRVAGIPVKEEPAPGSGERFPHLYGPLPLDAVRLALPWEAPTP